MDEKNMALALLISFFLTGLGIAYAGDVRKGLSVFGLYLILNIISIYAFGMILGIIIFALWVYGMYATYCEVNIYNGS